MNAARAALGILRKQCVKVDEMWWHDNIVRAAAPLSNRANRVPGRIVTREGPPPSRGACQETLISANLRFSVLLTGLGVGE
jgi:hypothetical protein